MKYIIATLLLTLTMSANAIGKYSVCPDGTVVTGSLTCNVSPPTIFE